MLSMSSDAQKRRKRKATVFAIAKLFKLLGVTLIIILSFTLIIASIAFFSFRDTENSNEYSVKLRTQPQTKAVSVKSGDSSIVKMGYLPVSSLNGLIGVRVVGDSKGITISNPSGTEVMEIVPGSDKIIVNNVWKKAENVVLYEKGECYLPMDLINKYTCLSVSYDEKNLLYTVSLDGTEDISFFPKNSNNDTPMKKLEA